MTDSIPVLLHAAARGARLQCRDLDDVWGNSIVAPMKDPIPGLWRIHPEDAHLRYGPISSVLYEAAKNPPENGDDAMPQITSLSVLMAIGDYLHYKNSDKSSRSLFLLFVAESLLEQGL